MQFRTTGGQLKKCELSMHWPEEMTFVATATKKVAAEKMTAALACLKLKVRIIFKEKIYIFLLLLFMLVRNTWCRKWNFWIKTTTH